MWGSAVDRKLQRQAPVLVLGVLHSDRFLISFDKEPHHIQRSEGRRVQRQIPPVVVISQ